MSWTAPELVCRAVRLIPDRALDRRSEAELGAPLGVSARHLRRLFIAHVGVTPDGLARSARSHFARRLFDDTDLNVTEIAFAAGFGSLRQFNRARQEVFRESPVTPRRRRLSAGICAGSGLAAQRAGPPLVASPGEPPQARPSNAAAPLASEQGRCRDFAAARRIAAQDLTPRMGRGEPSRPVPNPSLRRVLEGFLASLPLEPVPTPIKRAAGAADDQGMEQLSGTSR